VDALGGAPGAYSARYAGEGNSFEKNIDLLLQNMEGEKNRNARFRTVISLILDKKEYFFEGICKGEILKERRGNRGFGYDPVFRPEGSELSFGGMGLEEKNKYSHRKKAVDQMIRFIQSNYK
jgi:XTP/dITP diphosphohydrolase